MTAPVVHLPDLSEFQTGAQVDKLRALILRAHNGHRADHAYADLRKRSTAAVVRGHYLYLVADRDPAAQAREFAAVVGHLSAGEFAVVDLEEGAGDQSGRLELAAHTIDHALGGQAWAYSDVDFFAHHLSTHRPRWVAAYGQAEPRGPHTLWQHTNGESYRGIGRVDCSLYHGTLAQLRRAVDDSQGRPHATSTPAGYRPWPAGQVLEHAPAQSVGEWVRQTQDRLHARGWHVDQTGTYTAGTAAVVEAFQRDMTAHGHPLTVDGKTGRLTWDALWHAPITR